MKIVIAPVADRHAQTAGLHRRARADRSRSLGILLAGAAAWAVPLPAFAQADTARPADPIIVTGSRLSGPTGPTGLQIRALDGDRLRETGKVTIGDILNEQPEFRATFSQQNSSRALGTAGLNLLDLRGLDKKRTLVLQNGRRHVAADLLSGAASVDINQIPAGLIERVDVVTGGNSAVYGSDAIAGVVNFVLRQDFEGIELRGQSGISTYGDASNQFVGLLAGSNFSQGRGNLAVDLEYARQADFYAPSRPHTRELNGWFLFDSDPAGSPAGSDGVADRRFLRDVRPGFQSDGGTVLAIGPTGVTPYLFQRDGTLVRQTGTNSGSIQLGAIPLFIGGNGSNPNTGKRLGLMPRLERASANLIGHFEISPAFTPFIEAKFVRTDSLGNSSGPFFLPSISSPRLSFTTTNPFLTDQARTMLRTLGGDLFGPGRVFGPDGIPDSDQSGFVFTRMVTDLGNREEAARRQTWRVVSGARGRFGSGDNWNYEVSLNYARFREATRITGNVDAQRFLLAIDAVRDPASGAIVCRSQIAPSAARPYELAGNAALAAARLARDVQECKPANLFGEGNLSAQARDYILQDTVSHGRITQMVAGGHISGDSAGIVMLPGGPIAIAFGAEYRRETVDYRQDDIVSGGLTLYNPLPTFDPPAFSVREAYGELRLPILKDAVLAHRLTASLAARISDYRGAAGTTFAWNGSAEYAPVADLTLRASYARAVRAPNLSERYSPLGTNFATVRDPCSANFIATGSPTRAANCAAAGMPQGFNHIYTTGLSYRSGGNLSLREETSDSFTLGAELTPRLIPGLSLSASYYDITVNDVIASPNAQTILNACYDAASLANPFCGLFQRAGTGGGPQGEAPFRIIEGSLRAVQLNYAKLKARGIDTQLRYAGSLFGQVELATALTWSRALQNDEYFLPDDPKRANQRLLEASFPRDSMVWDASLRRGRIALGYQLRYIGKAVLNDYEDTYAKQGRDPQNADYAEVRFIGDAFYHDLRLAFTPQDGHEFYLGVDNIGNRLPPAGLTGAGASSGLYDVRGRYFYAGARFEL
jgi:outer membrane receptor protein involved in Fe transport